MRIELIEDKKSYDPSKVEDKTLVDDHRLLHIGWANLQSNKKWGSWTKEEIWNTHSRIAREMKKRGFKHNLVEKSLDSGTFFEEIKNLSLRIQNVLTGVDTFMVSPGFISVAGSSAEGKENSQDLDLVIKLKSRNETIEEKLANQPSLASIKPSLHFIYDLTGSHGKNVPIYDLVAVKRQDLTVEKPEYSFPLFGAAPRLAAKQSGRGVLSAYLHKDANQAGIYDADGNQIINYPHIESEAALMEKPETFILFGYLSSDGRFFAEDILRWNSTELILSPEEERKFFLDKFIWTTNISKAKEETIEFAEEISLMKPFTPLKTKSGYGTNEFNDIDDLIRFWAAGDNLRIGIAIQEKSDGFRINFMKKGSVVKAFTEDKKRDRADMLSTITAEIKQLPVSELILDTEVVMYDEKGRAMPRHESMAVIASKTPITSPIKANIHDCLWFNGPKNNEPYSERIALARKAVPKDTKHLRVMPTLIAHTEEQLRTYVKQAAKTPGSEGAMLKVLTSTYPLTGRTPLWAKLKFVKEVTLKVIGIRQKAAAGGGPSNTFLYRGAFLNQAGKLEPMYSQHIIGPADLKEEAEWKMGEGFKNAQTGDYGYAETYASNVKAKLGDLITVAPIHILKFKGKDDKEKYAFMFPRMRNLETAKLKPDTVEQLDRLAALGEGSEKMKLEDMLNLLKPEDFPLTIKEV